jgi:DNA recombination protein RmuC
MGNIMEIVLLALLIILIVLVAVLILIVILRKNKTTVEGVDEKSLELLQTKLEMKNDNNANDIKTALLGSFRQNDEKLNAVESKMKDWVDSKTRETQENLEKSSSELRQKLTDIALKTEPIGDVKTKVNHLDNLLSQNNKAGKAGEYMLERMLGNLAGNSKNDNILFDRQYTMIKKTEDGKALRPDLFIKGNGSNFVNIPVDAKFPFNVFEKLLETNDNTNEEYKKLEKDFVRDVKSRIDEAAKYISKEDNTVYTVMFIPSEGIFSFILGQTDLIDYAFKKCVIIAGPSTLLAIVQSVDQYMKLFANISQYEDRVKVLGKVVAYIGNYDDSMAKLFDAIDKLIKANEDVKTKEHSLTKEYDKLLKEADLTL